MKTHPLPIYLQRFFTERLGTQLKASPNTITSYRDTFRLLLKYAADLLRRPPTELQVADIPTLNNPLGMKGVAEVGCIGAPAAVMNAIIDALDGRELDMPATPEAVWRALNGSRSK